MSRDLRGLGFLRYLHSKQILLFGLVPLLLGILALAGWFFSQPILVSIIPHSQHMVISTAFLLTIAGSTLVYIHFNPDNTRTLSIIVGSTIISIGAIALIEAVYDYSWIDFNSMHSSLTADSPQHAGRMAPNTAIGFILLGALFVFAHANLNRIESVLNLGITLILILLGLLGVSSYILNLEFIYSFYQNNRMSLPTAVSLLFAAISISRVRRRHIFNSQHQIEAGSIYSVSTFLLFAIVLVVAIFSFALSQTRAEHIMAEQMTEIATDRRAYFLSVINLKTQSAKVNADRPLLVRYILANADHDNPEFIHTITKMLNAYLAQGFAGLQLQDKQGKSIAEVGRFADSPDLRVPIKDNIFSELLWEQGYVLHNRVPMLDPEGNIVAYMDSEQLLTELTEFHKAAVNRGETSDMVVCGLHHDNQICFPFRWSPEPMILNGYLDGKPLPLTRAVKGETDTYVTTDFRRERVMASIGPIGTTGLGMAIKMDMREQYAPIRVQFVHAIPFFLLLILVSIVLMRQKLKPIVNAIEESKQQLTYQANHDPLTSLPNRLLFADRLDTAILRANRSSGFLALMYVDIDHFKRINDNFGHKVGDTLLRWFANQLQEAVRATDTVARLGGDEFSIILENLSSRHDAEHLAATIIDKVATNKLTLPESLSADITTSIGIAFYKDDMEAEELLQLADTALYKAKNEGRNTYRVAD